MSAVQTLGQKLKFCKKKKNLYLNEKKKKQIKSNDGNAIFNIMPLIKKGQEDWWITRLKVREGHEGQMQ